MIHQPASSYYDGQAGECVMEAEEVLKLRDCITRVYAQRTGKSLWMISEDMERDVFLSAEEAQDYGIADFIASDNTLKN
jgi:ATP-dependent Clp protease protease subunit